MWGEGLGLGRGARVLAAVVTMSLAGCAEPILDTSRIPPGISTAGLVFHRTNWFECAVAVYRLDDAFAGKVRTEGLAALPSTTDGSGWTHTPAERDDNYMSVEAGNRVDTGNCLKAEEPYSELYAKYAYGEGGFYQETGPGGTNIIAPAEGLLFVGGFD